MRYLLIILLLSACAYGLEVTHPKHIPACANSNSVYCQE